MPPPGTEIHTAQPIGKEHVLFIQNGDPALLKVVNVVTGATVKEFPLPVSYPKNVHSQFRHARLTPNGTLLIAHRDSCKVSEYSSEGKVLWSYTVPTPWGVEPLKNGNVLITARYDVREVNRKGEIVWQFTPSEVPDYPFGSLQEAWRLPNGNTLINSWGNSRQIQALELTPEKKAVWVLHSWNNPVNLAPSTTIQLLDKATPPEDVTFGEIR